VAQSSTHFHAVEGYPSLSPCFLPSHTYQQAKCITEEEEEEEEEEEAYSSNCWVVAATRLFTFYPLDC
jgi:hypothetical protein